VPKCILLVESAMHFPQRLNIAWFLATLRILNSPKLDFRPKEAGEEKAPAADMMFTAFHVENVSVSR